VKHKLNLNFTLNQNVDIINSTAEIMMRLLNKYIYQNEIS